MKNFQMKTKHPPVRWKYTTRMYTTFQTSDAHFLHGSRKVHCKSFRTAQLSQQL